MPDPNPTQARRKAFGPDSPLTAKTDEMHARLMRMQANPNPNSSPTPNPTLTTTLTLTLNPTLAPTLTLDPKPNPNHTSHPNPNPNQGRLDEAEASLTSVLGRRSMVKVQS